MVLAHAAGSMLTLTSIGKVVWIDHDDLNMRLDGGDRIVKL
jgi:hypothetical protein